jgi:hypothetical protein
MEDDLSIMTTIEQSDNKGVIFVDEEYIGRLASVIDAEDRNRPGENTLFGSPYPKFPDQKKEIKRENNRGFIEEGGMLADKIANPLGELEGFTFYEIVKINTDVDVGSDRFVYPYYLRNCSFLLSHSKIGSWFFLICLIISSVNTTFFSL